MWDLLHQSGTGIWVQSSLCLMVDSDTHLTLTREQMHSRRVRYFFGCLFFNHLFMQVKHHQSLQGSFPLIPNPLYLNSLSTVNETANISQRGILQSNQDNPSQLTIKLKMQKEQLKIKLIPADAALFFHSFLLFPPVYTYIQC